MMSFRGLRRKLDKIGYLMKGMNHIQEGIFWLGIAYLLAFAIVFIIGVALKKFS